MTPSNHTTKDAHNKALSDAPAPVPEVQRKFDKLRHKGEEVRDEVKETEKEINHKIETLKRSR